MALAIFVGASSTIAETGDTVARIGTDTISAADYQDYLVGYLRAKLYHGGSPERLRELAGEAMDSLIERQLFLQEARRRRISGDQNGVSKRIDALRDQYSGSENWPAIEPRLPALAEKLLADSQIAALEAAVKDVAPPTEAELRAFHAANLDLFTEPAAWDLDLILLKVPPSALPAEWQAAGDRAEGIAAAIRAGQDFANAAAEYSQHESSVQGGKVGRVHAGQLPIEAQAAVEKLTLGEISDPVRILEGYVILHLNARIPARIRPLEDVRERAEALYRRNTGSQNWASLLARLRAETAIEIQGVEHIVEALIARE